MKPGGYSHVMTYAVRRDFRFLITVLRIVYVWGYNGYCRLGLGNQQDALIAKVVPQVRSVCVTWIL